MFFNIKIYENSISSQLIVKAGMFTFDKEKTLSKNGKYKRWKYKIFVRYLFTYCLHV